MYRLAKKLLVWALVCGGLTDATPYRRRERGLRIPLQPHIREKSLASKPDDPELGQRTVRAPNFTWGADPMRGVNIGGWLVLEPWITPSMFEGKPTWVDDEYTYGAYMSTQPDPMGEIRYHWNTWFQFYELESIAASGLNTIRIQVGFWSLIPLENGERFLVGAFEYLKLAVTWAQSLNLKCLWMVMLDLHGAPGSQNGFDNSGLRSTREWFYNRTNVDRTLAALQVLTAEFTQPSYGDCVIAIEVLNEPFPQADWETDFLKTFYTSAYDTVRAAAKHPNVVVAIDSAFKDLEFWDGFMTEPGWSGVALDTHIYSMFNLDTLALGYAANLEWTCSQLSSLEDSNNQRWTIVGEFTPAHTDCARWLNGRGTGARWDNTLNTSAKLDFPGDCSVKTGADGSTFGADYFEHLARSFETQTWVYERASGWIMWTWKTEEAADWSMTTGMLYGWIPNPIWSKPHGTPCNLTTSTTHAEPPKTSGSSASRRMTASFDSATKEIGPLCTIILLLTHIWLV